MKELLRFMSIEPETKFDVLGMKSLAELLYFERRYEEALSVGERIMKIGDFDKGLGSGDRSEVEDLVLRCRRRLTENGAVKG